jgi:hypothetical protein
MTSDQIPLDFVAGSHGHFLENILNKYFGITDTDQDAFTSLGTSHKISQSYIKNRVFVAEHWSERYQDQLKNFPTIVSIRFDLDDLLLLSSVSLLRAGDQNIDNNTLEINTVEKLNNEFYQDTLELIYQSYPFLDRTQKNIPRYVLREFFKFGFRDPEQNGYWLKLKELTYLPQCRVFYFEFKDFYNVDLLVARIKDLELFLNRKFNFSSDFYQQHQKFLSFVPYIQHKNMCDSIVNSVQQRTTRVIPLLSLLQESYINAQLENIFNKEMPFHQDRYFTSTQDMLYYIDNLAPNL